MVRKKQTNPRALGAPPDNRVSSEERDLTNTYAAVSTSRRSVSTSDDLCNPAKDNSVVVSIEDPEADLIRLQVLATDCQVSDTTVTRHAGTELRLSLVLQSTAIAWSVEELTSTCVKLHVGTPLLASTDGNVVGAEVMTLFPFCRASGAVIQLLELSV